MRAVEIKKWGNSGAIILQASLLQALDCQIGMVLEISVDGDCLTLKPKRKPRLAELLALSVGCWEQNDEDCEWLNMAPVGKEIIK